MHKVDEHGVGGEDADGLVEQGGEDASLTFFLKPVEGETEEQNRADGIDEALRTAQ